MCCSSLVEPIVLAECCVQPMDPTPGTDPQMPEPEHQHRHPGGGVEQAEPVPGAGCDDQVDRSQRPHPGRHQPALPVREPPAPRTSHEAHRETHRTRYRAHTVTVSTPQQPPIAATSRWSDGPRRIPINPNRIAIGPSNQPTIPTNGTQQTITPNSPVTSDMTGANAMLLLFTVGGGTSGTHRPSSSST